MNKLIITVALTGNVPTKEMNEYVPLTVEEVVRDAQECAELGAAVAHIHARDEEGKPTARRDRFQAIVQAMDAAGVDMIKQLSTGARAGENTVEWRGQMLDLPIEMASLTTGSANFPNMVNANAPDLVDALARKMKERGIKPELEVFDAAMINNAMYLQKRGLVDGPLHFNFVMNVGGSLPGTPKNLVFLYDSLPAGATWTVSGIGRSQVQMITMGIAMGGHVRTGMEDVLEYEKGVPATNAMLVERVVRIAKAVGREIATPAEAREILGI